MGKEEEILKPLNDAQLEAVLSFGKPLLVLAGPGAGKTRVIVHKIAYILWKRPISFQRILGVTFTNKAAGEMRERVERLVGSSAPVDLMTFHAFGARVLRKFSNLKTIFDRDDSLAIIKRLMKERGWKDAKPSQLLEKISRAKSNLIYPWDEAQLPLLGFSPEEAELYRDYQDKIEEVQGADFDDLIAKTVLLLDERQEVASYFRNLYGYILVDEFQDTSPGQYEILKRIASSPNICVVGDEDQSIYSWRGASLENIFDFERDFPDVKVVILNVNYRSIPSIVKAASSMISANRRRHPKRLKNFRQGALPIFFRRNFSREEEALFVAEVIQNLLGRRDLLPVAVFYRANYQSRLLEEALSMKGISYKLLGTVGFFERKEVKDVIAYLRVIHNPSDEVSLIRALHHIPRGVGKATDERILREKARLGDGVEAVREVARSLSGKRKKGLEEFLEVLQGASEKLEQEGVGSAVEFIVSSTGFMDYLKESDKTGSRVENLQELIRMTKAMEAAGLGLEEFLQRASLTTSLDAKASGDVLLSTLHAAKGLEFESVIIVSIDEGFIPHAKVDSSEGIEEERRLLYVGMTRAKKLLLLSTATALPSRFLASIPSELVQVVEFPSQVVPPASGRFFHPSLGYGEIIKKEGGRIIARMEDGKIVTFLEDMVNIEYLD